MISVALLVIFGIGAICEGFSERSARLSQFIANVKGIADRSVFFKKYGIYMLIPFILVPGVGLYGLRHSRLAFFLERWLGDRGDYVRWTALAMIILFSTVGIIGFVR